MTIAQPPVPQPVRRLRDRLGPYGALLTTTGIGAAVFVALLVGSAEVYGAVADSDGVSGLDQPILDQALQVRTPASAAAVTFFTNLGDTEWMVVFVLLLAALMFWRWRRRTVLVLTTITMVGSLIFTAVGKNLVGRNRPPLEFAVPPYEYAPSFPSGHTLNSTAFAAISAYLAIWLARSTWVRVVAPVLAVAWAGAMGLSRIYLGHHWFTDVAFGWLFALAWVALIVTVHRVLLSLDRREADSQAALDEQEEDGRAVDGQSSVGPAALEQSPAHSARGEHHDPGRHPAAHQRGEGGQGDDRGGDIPNA